MAKTEVYSWRLDPEMKEALAREARKQGESLADLLERIARSWLVGQKLVDDSGEEARSRAAALRSFGTLAGGDPHRAERARATLRKRIARRNGR